mmetsp:Transcript_14844/g.56176  ORF Transcript_14844/g.56176 Transcript_14844/m.56176 type:complete len:213 (+) Transcript_14844:23808-24446(+)
MLKRRPRPSIGSEFSPTTSSGRLSSFLPSLVMVSRTSFFTPTYVVSRRPSTFERPYSITACCRDLLRMSWEVASSAFAQAFRSTRLSSLSTRLLAFMISTSGMKGHERYEAWISWFSGRPTYTAKAFEMLSMVPSSRSDPELTISIMLTMTPFCESFVLQVGIRLRTSVVATSLVHFEPSARKELMRLSTKSLLRMSWFSSSRLRFATTLAA